MTLCYNFGTIKNIWTHMKETLLIYFWLKFMKHIKLQKIKKRM
jgi:hypothetical protein